MSRYSEPEEGMTSIENANFSPLEQPINEKPYTRPNVTMSQEDMMSDIPEPSFAPPPIDLNRKKEEVKAEPKVKEAKEPFNPEMKELPKKEQTKNAKMVAKMIMSGYKELHKFGNKAMMFNENKLRKLSTENEVDFTINIPYDHTGAQIPAYEFIKEYNEQQQDALTVDQDFEDEVMPVLTRVLEKRGVGVTDEQYLIYMFGKDIAVKGSMMYAAMSQKKEIINILKDLTQQKGGGAPPPPPPQQTYNEPPPPPSGNPIYTEGYGNEESSYRQDEQEVDYEDIDISNFEFTAPSVADEVEAQLNGISVSELKKKQGRGRPPKN